MGAIFWVLGIMVCIAFGEITRSWFGGLVAFGLWVTANMEPIDRDSSE